MAPQTPLHPRTLEAQGTPYFTPPPRQLSPTKPTGPEAEIKVGAGDTRTTPAKGGAPSERATRACSWGDMAIPAPRPLRTPSLSREGLWGVTAGPPISASCFYLGKGRIAPPARTCQEGVTFSQQRDGV